METRTGKGTRAKARTRMRTRTCTSARRRPRDLALLFLLVLAKVSSSAALTFDNQLVIIANDCYTRVAIGSKLPEVDVLSMVEVNSISECEDACSKRRSICNSFSFGVGTRGNGSCAISGRVPNPEDLLLDPDYDLYIRSERSPYCAPDRLYKMGGGTRDWMNGSRPTGFGSGLLTILPTVIQSPRPGGRNISVMNRTRLNTYINDEERRISDIVRNRNQGSQLQRPFIGSSFAVLDKFKEPILPAVEDDKRFHDGIKFPYGQRLYPQGGGYEGYGFPSRPRPFIGENRHFTRPNIQHSVFDNDEYGGDYNVLKNRPSKTFPKPFEGDEIPKTPAINAGGNTNLPGGFPSGTGSSEHDATNGHFPSVRPGPGGYGGYNKVANSESFDNGRPNVFSGLIGVQDGFPRTTVRPFDYWTNRQPDRFRYQVPAGYNNNYNDFASPIKYHEQFSSGKSPAEFGRWTSYNGAHQYSTVGSYSNRNVFSNPVVIHDFPKTTVRPMEVYWTTPAGSSPFDHSTVGYLNRKDQNLSQKNSSEFSSPDDLDLTTPSGYGMKIPENVRCQ